VAAGRLPHAAAAERCQEEGTAEAHPPASAGRPAAENRMLPRQVQRPVRKRARWSGSLLRCRHSAPQAEGKPSAAPRGAMEWRVPPGTRREFCMMVSIVKAAFARNVQQRCCRRAFSASAPAFLPPAGTSSSFGSSAGRQKNIWHIDAVVKSKNRERSRPVARSCVQPPPRHSLKREGGRVGWGKAGREILEEECAEHCGMAVKAAAKARYTSTAAAMASFTRHGKQKQPARS